jgi:benzoyl-CoA 2,3-epoxidase subunit B
MSSINYSEKIPNNVNLSEDRTLQRALEQWQPNFLSWWNDMGPDGFQNFDVYLRTAVSVDPQGWAQFGHVKMPDYRWGIFLNPGEKDRKIHFGDHKGEARLAGRARRVPRQPAPHHRHAGRHRAGVGRAAAPPGPDRAQPVRPAQPVPGQRRGRPPPVGHGLPAAQVLRPRRPRGRRGAARAPQRRQQDNPRILGPSTRRRPTGCRFFMFTYFTDRDGKFQLCALAESSFDPLARTDQVHADRGGAPHVRGRVRRQPRHPAHLPGDERAEDRRPRASCAPPA